MDTRVALDTVVGGCDSRPCPCCNWLLIQFYVCLMADSDLWQGGDGRSRAGRGRNVVKGEILKESRSVPGGEGEGISEGGEC